MIIFFMALGCLMVLVLIFVLGFCYGVKTAEKLDHELIDLLKRDKRG